MRLILSILIIAVIIASPCLGKDVEITEVIEIGPCSGPLYQPIKWSPYGSHIAFFRGKTLMIADTLGNQQAVHTIELTPRSFEWANDTSIAYTQRDITTGKEKTYRLSLVTLSGEETVLENEQVSRDNSVSFSRIRRTASGVAYYRSDVKGANTAQLLSHWDRDKAEVLSKHHDLELVDGRVCKISLDNTDTVVVLPTPHVGLVASSDYSVLLTDGIDNTMVAYDLDAGSCDTIVAPELPSSDEVYCVVLEYDIRPTKDLLIYSLTCDEKSGHYTRGTSICIYDREERASRVLTSLAYSKHQRSPLFSSNGRFFSFVADGIGAFIVRLGVK